MYSYGNSYNTTNTGTRTAIINDSDTHTTESDNSIKDLSVTGKVMFGGSIILIIILMIGTILVFGSNED